MVSTYNNCVMLTGNAACGPNVVYMGNAYRNCYNLDGAPACGDNVVNMQYAYTNCYSLTGTPVCGNNVANMRNAYWNCTNLTGCGIIGRNVVDCGGAFTNTNISSINIYSPYIIESMTNGYPANYRMSIQTPNTFMINIINLNVTRSVIDNIYMMYSEAINTQHCIVQVNQGCNLDFNNNFNAYNISVRIV